MNEDPQWHGGTVTYATAGQLAEIAEAGQMTPGSRSR